MNDIAHPLLTAADRETFFIALYKSAFPSVARYIARMGGSADDAKDIFQDALLICYEKKIAARDLIKASEKAYLIGVCKHLWHRRYREVQQVDSLEGIDIPEKTESPTCEESRLMNYLEKAGKKCMEFLRAFYYDNLPLADAAILFGFSGTRSATVQKYKCLEKVRETVKQKSLTYEDFVS
ncbi:MAG TPA: sigma-70 family RNA polymerase sigma factor [Mucilaginibacter sp.]|nr:sigma-70 family RNA polymerase sigma factor [Mucilaginibacter sp.]